jgi:hypothetical protein
VGSAQRTPCPTATCRARLDHRYAARVLDIVALVTPRVGPPLPGQCVLALIANHAACVVGDVLGAELWEQWALAVGGYGAAAVEVALVQQV